MQSSPSRASEPFGSLWKLSDREQAQLKVRVGKGWFRTSLDQHVQAVNDEVILYASVLIHSYALAESAAVDALGLRRASGGIESWGKALLDNAGASWSDVRDGEPGAVEVAVVRNAFAHGTRVIDDGAAKRLADAGAPPRAAGSTTSLEYDELRTFRSRLQSLLNQGGLERKS